MLVLTVLLAGKGEATAAVAAGGAGTCGKGGVGSMEPNCNASLFGVT